jgi:hypothetical protein
MPAYVPVPTDPTQPADSVKASTAAPEFRALKQYIQTLIVGAIPSVRNQLQGFQLTPTAGFAEMIVNRGVCADSTNVASINLSVGANKTTGPWAVGSTGGCLDTGSIAPNTWYFFYAIRQDASPFNVDWLCSLSASAPTMPATYTQRRLIGAWKTNGSSLWEDWYQVEDDVWFKTPITTNHAVLPNTTARRLDNILGASFASSRKVTAHMLMQGFCSSGAGYCVWTDPDSTDITAAPGIASTLSLAQLACHGSAASVPDWTTRQSLRLGSGGTVGVRVSSTNVSPTSVVFGINLAELRGRNAT